MFRIIRFLFALFILFILIPAGESNAQVPVTRSENKVILEGKVYYIHIVKPGQTLFSIAHAYEVTEKDIAIENPGVYSGLQVGQVLKIPLDVKGVSRPQEKETSSEYIRHYLKEGETLFSLSRSYNVSVEAIESANPGVDVTDLPIGKLVLIPRLEVVYSREDFYFHKVRRKQTVFSLSRRYGVTEDDIIDYNPELKWGNLKTGQVIRIPRQNFLAREKQHSVISREQNQDTVSENQEFIAEKPYSEDSRLTDISLDEYEYLLKDFNRRELNVAFMIPFNYRAPEPEEITEEEENIPETEEEKRIREQEELLPRSPNFLEFFEGSLLALDSLRREGISLNIRYFDTHKSPTRVREIINDDFFDQVDLIIGPFYAYNVEIVSAFSNEHKIPLISPFYDGEEIIKNNPYLFQINPSYRTEYKKAAEYLSREYDKNFVFIYQTDSFNYHEIDYFKTCLMDNLRNYTHPENVVVKEISYYNAAKANLPNDLSHALSRDKKNIVVIPENKEAFVSTVITQLYFQLRDYEIEVFGLPSFHEYSNIDFQYYHALKLSYLSPFYFDYKDEQVKHFLKKYMSAYYTEPKLSTRKGCPYAFVGYDITYFFIKNIYQNKRRFISRLNQSNVDNLLPDFRFQKSTSIGGFENQTLKLVHYGDDFSIKVKDADSFEEPHYKFGDIIF